MWPVLYTVYFILKRTDCTFNIISAFSQRASLTCLPGFFLLPCLSSFLSVCLSLLVSVFLIGSEWFWAPTHIWDRHRYQHYKEEARPSQTGERERDTLTPKCFKKTLISFWCCIMYSIAYFKDEQPPPWFCCEHLDVATLLTILIVMILFVCLDSPSLFIEAKAY